MTPYAQQLAALQRAIIERESDDVLALIKAANAGVRIAIYADGYIIRLCNAVRGDYPALQHYVGGEVFENMLQHYVRQTPSHNWDLNLYSQGFLTYILQYNKDVLAHDIAAIESAIAATYWSKSGASLAPDALQNLSLEALADMCFTPHMASRLLLLNSNANEYIKAFRACVALPEMVFQTNYLLVLRAEYEVKRYALEPLEYQLLSSLFAGKTFGQALEEIAELPDCNVPELLAKLPIYCSRWMGWALWRR